MSLVEIFTIIIVHYFADFIMQDEKWAVNKSTSIKSLLSHTITYSLVWLVFGVTVGVLLGILGLKLFSFYDCFLFSLITFTVHTLTDFFTSKEMKKLSDVGKLGSSIPNMGMYSFLGFDQILHYIQLFLTYYYIFKF